MHIMTGDDDFVWHMLGTRRRLRPSSFLDLRESGDSRTLPTPSRSLSNPPDPARRLRPTSPAEPPASLFCLSRLPSSCGAVSTDRDGRDGTLARALRAARLSRGALAPHASARSLDRATPRLSVLSTSVAGRRSCLASSLRSSRVERGSGARIATGRPSRDAR